MASRMANGSAITNSSAIANGSAIVNSIAIANSNAIANVIANVPAANLKLRLSLRAACVSVTQS